MNNSILVPTNLEEENKNKPMKPIISCIARISLPDLLDKEEKHFMRKLNSTYSENSLFSLFTLSSPN